MSILDSIDKFKGLEGSNIYAKPTGNEARRWNGEPIEFTVIKLGRKYVTLKRYSEDNYLPSSGATQSAIKSGYVNNSGYKFFSSLEALNEHQEKVKLALSIGKKCRYFSFASLSVDDLNVINSILSKGDTDD